MNTSKLKWIAVAGGLLGVVACSSNSGLMNSIRSVPGMPSQAQSAAGYGGAGDAAQDSISRYVPGQAQGYANAGIHNLWGMPVGRQDEDQMGQAVAVGVTNMYPLDTNGALNKYVALVGYTVAEASPRPDGNFLFGVLATDSVGAYSGPNGYVMITRGAIKQMRDEAELAGVLAHEIAHVCNEDGMNAVRNEKLTGAAADSAKTALSTQNYGSMFNSAVDSGTDVVLRKGYSRGQEEHADKSAVKYVVAAGYDPNSYLNFIRRIEVEQAGTKSSPLFSTHPGMAERVTIVSEAIGKVKGSGGATNAERFLSSTR